MFWLNLLHQAFFGAVAAAGFGILFNFGSRSAIWCAAAGAVALAVRTTGLGEGLSLEAASFAAAVATRCVMILLRERLGPAGNSMALTGCIPMVPGAFFGQAILGMFAVTAPHAANADTTILLAMEYMLRVFFTLAAIGAGLSIPGYLLRTRNF